MPTRVFWVILDDLAAEDYGTNFVGRYHLVGQVHSVDSVWQKQDKFTRRSADDLNERRSGSGLAGHEGILPDHSTKRN